MKGLSGKRVEIPSMEEIMQERKRLRERQRQEEREKLPEVGVVGSCDV